MIECEIAYKKKGVYRKEYAYTLTDFPWKKLKAKKTSNKHYIDIPITFDIETSTIIDNKKSKLEKREVYESFVYIMQFCIEDKVLFIRKFSEFREVMHKLKKVYKLDSDTKLVVYVHNLSYEWQFIHQFYEMQEVFASDKRKVLKCTFDSVFEFRCSYMLTNMNLEKFIQNTPNNPYIKGVGDLDYKKVYTPIDELTPKEYGYCYNDVKGLYRSILFRLVEYNISNIPMTSTGYIRKKCRNEMATNKDNRKQFLKSKMDLNLYQLCKDCFRGGNTHGNRYYIGQIIDNVYSYDISSCYPYAMVIFKYPTGKAMQLEIETMDELKEYTNKYLYMGRFTFFNLRLKNKRNTPIPYIPISKCTKLYGKQFENYVSFNGRLLESDYIEIPLTSIDMKIILNMYEFDSFLCDDCYWWRKDYLSKELVSVVLELFENKSKLKNKVGFEYEYAKTKALLNSVYGMMVTDILHNDVIYDEYSMLWEIRENNDINKYYNSRNSFLQYQQGVFITAYARFLLQEGIDLCIDKNGRNVCVYTDTDSVKCVGNFDKEFEKLNEERIKQAKKEHRKISCTVDNKEYILGVFEKDAEYTQFITLGAKKYAYIDKKDNDLHITVAGLNKQQGAVELKQKGGLLAFKEDTTFYNSGRSVAYYNNEPIHKLVVNGCEIENASSISIVETTYTLGITQEMKTLINML